MPFLSPRMRPEHHRSYIKIRIPTLVLVTCINKLHFIISPRKLFYLLRPPLQFLSDGGAQVSAGYRRCPCGAIAGRCVCSGSGIVSFIGPGGGGSDRAERNRRRWLAGGRRQRGGCRGGILAAGRLEARLRFRRACAAHRHRATHLHALRVHWLRVCEDGKARFAVSLRHAC